jgi:hypothetical protein
MSTDQIIQKITHSSNNKFSITTLDGNSNIVDEINKRENNKKLHLNVQCLRCQQFSTKSVYGIIRGKLKCSTCDHSYCSRAEKEIKTFIESIVKQKVHKRARIHGIEIDLLIPESNLGIEYNGLYWHSSAIQENPNHHNDKRIICAKNNIRLFHIFEDEWYEKRSIIESMLQHKLLKTPYKVGARKCSIRQLSEEERRQFFTMNHLDGDVHSFISYGLIYKSDIISAISLQTIDDHTLEIKRWANRCNTHISGGFSKLFSYILKKHNKNFVTYCDLRFGGNGGYCTQAGLLESHLTETKCWITDCKNRFNTSLLNDDNQNIALKRNFLIFGTQNSVFVYIRNTSNYEKENFTYK